MMLSGCAALVTMLTVALGIYRCEAREFPSTLYQGQGI